MNDSRPRPLRCHLPIRALSYPAAARILGSVRALCERCGSLRKTPGVVERCPVRSEARQGLQTGLLETACVKLTLLRSRRSRLGVLTLGPPAYPMACARH